MSKKLNKILKYRVTYLEMNSMPNFDWPKNLKHKLSIFLAEDFPSWYFLFFYKQVGEKYFWTDWLNKSNKEIFDYFLRKIQLYRNNYKVKKIDVLYIHQNDLKILSNAKILNTLNILKKRKFTQKNQMKMKKMKLLIF